MSQQIQDNSSRLLTIDSLRGIAALGVMLYHVCDAGKLFKQENAGTDFIFTLPVAFGFSGVYLFFVISGFCIHLRWVKHQFTRDNSQPLEFVAFWKRRIRRIYPAYLAAIALYLCLMSWQEGLQFSPLFVWDIFSHFLMIHNFDVRTVYSISGVFWTLAIEEQLYLAYFALIWLRRKFGWKVTISFTVLVRIAWFAFAFLLNNLFGVMVPVIESSFANWCIWTLGAVAVEGYYGLIKLPRWCRSISLFLVTFLLSCFLHYTDSQTDPYSILHKIIWLIEQPLWGISFFFFVNIVINLEHHKGSVIRNILAVLAIAGVFSYSLYLTHSFVNSILSEFNWFITAAACIIFAWLFYLMFEKPFIGGVSTKKTSFAGK